MIKVTFEFPTIDAAIVAMGKMVGAPGTSRAEPARSPAVETPVVGPDASTSRKRKPRADAGKPRGPYKDATAGQSAVSVVGAPADQAAVTDPSNVGATTPAPDTTSTSTPADPAVAPPDAEDATTIFARLFDRKGIVVAKELLQRHGVGRVRELLPAQRQGFIDECNELLKVAA